MPNNRTYDSNYNITEFTSNEVIYVDPETNVMYLYSGHGYNGGLSIMLNSDGSPKLYDEKTSIYNITELNPNNYIYVDTETNVMYLYIGHTYSGGLSIMLNSDGSPKLYDEKTSIYNIIEIKPSNFIYVDSETNVMYCYIAHDYGGGLSIMLDSDGLPKLYNQETSKYNIIKIKSRNLIYIDKETNVMYFYVEHGYGGGLSIMLNPSGSPKIYNKENSIYKVVEIEPNTLSYVDTETNTMYLYIEHGYCGDLNFMLDENGVSKTAN